MLVLTIFVGVAGLAAVVAGNYLQHVVARRALGGISVYRELPAHTEWAGTLPRAPHLRAVVPGERPRRRLGIHPRLLRRPSASVALFAVCFLAYATVGGVLVLHYGSIQGDAISRVADGWYVFFSRDPHLAAIGFVWNPLPSVLYMPFFAFKSIWPDLTQRGFACNLASALFMAGCVVQLRGILRDARIYRVLGWILILIFAVNPMIVYYGANGMTEAIYLFFLLVAARHTMRWLRSGGVRPLVVTGLALGLAYLVRYEAIPVIAATGTLVGFVAFRRAVGERKERMKAAVSDLVILGVAPAAAFIGWTGVSYVITGQPFQQFSSVYGNSAIIKSQGGIAVNYRYYSPAVLGAIQLLAYLPLIPVVVALVVVAARRRRDWVPAGLVVFAATIGFSFMAMVGGVAGPNLRYFMPGLPLWLVGLGYLYRAGRIPTRNPRPRRICFVVIALVLGALGTATTAVAGIDRHVSPVEASHLSWIFSGHVEGSAARVAKEYVPSVQKIAKQIDAMHLPSGSIVMDTYTGCLPEVLMTSSNPHQFIITSDRDFERVLADPPTFHAHYLLLPPASGGGLQDAVTRAYPTLYANGLSGARLIKTFHTRTCSDLRLYYLRRSLVR